MSSDTDPKESQQVAPVQLSFSLQRPSVGGMRANNCLIIHITDEGLSLRLDLEQPLSIRRLRRQLSALKLGHGANQLDLWDSPLRPCIALTCKLTMADFKAVLSHNEVSLRTNTIELHLRFQDDLNCLQFQRTLHYALSPEKHMRVIRNGSRRAKASNPISSAMPLAD